MSSRTATAALTTQARWALARAASMAEHEHLAVMRGEAGDSSDLAVETLDELAALVAVIPRLLARCAPGDPEALMVAEELVTALAGLGQKPAADTDTGVEADTPSLSGPSEGRS